MKKYGFRAGNLRAPLANRMTSKTKIKYTTVLHIDIYMFLIWLSHHPANANHTASAIINKTLRDVYAKEFAAFKVQAFRLRQAFSGLTNEEIIGHIKSGEIYKMV